jgi:mRNA interferase RelE/StbE
VNLIFTRAADKSLNGMPKRDAAAMLAKLKTFAADPFAPHGFAKALVGGGVRFRHGDWRAVCEVDGVRGTVVVLEIGHTREIYR